MRTFEDLRADILQKYEQWRYYHRSAYILSQSVTIVAQRIEERQKQNQWRSARETDPEWEKLKEYEREWAEKQTLEAKTLAALRAARARLDELGAPQKLIENWSADQPILLLPVRLQTRFVRVKHLAKGISQEQVFNYSAPFSEAVPGVNQPAASWAENGLIELASIDQLRERGDAAQQQFARDLLNPLTFNSPLRTADPQAFLRPQADAFELLIRIYPDDIFVHGHEENLTYEELKSGKTFWEQYWNIQQAYPNWESEVDQDQKKEELVKAWSVLQSEYLPARAAWIYHKMRPSNYPIGARPQFQGPPTFDYSKISIRTSEWTEPMQSYVLPDRFVAILYGQDGSSREVQGVRIRYPLAFSQDPRSDTTLEEVPNELEWITDFEAAEAIGMAIRVPISHTEYTEGFSKLMVLGLNVSWNEQTSKEQLEELLVNHQYKEGGLSILPQGTPTNNFEGGRSGYTFTGPTPEAIFDRLEAPPSTPATHWSERTDGAFLADLLGIDAEKLRSVYRSDGKDIATARAMNQLLWPATFGYYLYQFFRPLLSIQDINRTADFFAQYVSGRGLLPALQIGNQPYGILATTAYSTLAFDAEAEWFLEKLYTNALEPLNQYWSQLVPKVKHLGDDSLEIHKYSQDFVDIIGLQASSESYFYRPVFGEYVLWNAFRASKEPNEADFDNRGPRDKWLHAHTTRNPNRGRDQYISDQLLKDFHRIFKAVPRMPGVELSSPLRHNRIFRQHFPIINRPFSEKIIDAYRPSEQRVLAFAEGAAGNYLQQLARSDYQQLAAQFESDQLKESARAPLFFHLARQGLSRAYLECAVALALAEGKVTRISLFDFELEQLFDETRIEGEVARFANPVAGISVESFGLGNIVYEKRKWDYLDSPRYGEKGKRIEEHLKKVFSQNGATALSDRLAAIDAAVRPLAESKIALELLSKRSTASLARLFSEHVDLCSYRLDAWMQGIVNKRLTERSRSGKATEGLFIGAFGYVEQLRKGPTPGVVFKVVAQPELVEKPPRDWREVVMPVLAFDAFTNQQPNLASILANAYAYLGNDYGTRFQLDTQKPDRVVAAPQTATESQGFMHLPSQGHAAMAALLRAAYQANNPGQAFDAFAVNLNSKRIREASFLIEGVQRGQGLPELIGYQFERAVHDHPDPTLQTFILPIRKRFPLATATRVVDGLALVRYYRKVWKAANANLREIKSTFKDNVIREPITETQLTSLVEVVGQISHTLDGLSDLLLSESIFQITKGSLTGAAAALKMFNNEAELAQPELLKDESRGPLLSQVLAITFDLSTSGPAWPGALSPQAQLGAPINHWLARTLPAPHLIVVVVKSPSYQQGTKVSLREVGLQPIDLVNGFDGPELSDRIKGWFANQHPKEDPTKVVLDDRDRTSLAVEEYSLYELRPLLETVQQLLRNGRPLLPTDLQLSLQTDRAGAHPMPSLDNRGLLAKLNQLGHSTRAIESIRDNYEQWEAIRELVRESYGDQAVIVPTFTLANQSEFEAAYAFPDLLADAGPFAREEWLQGLAQVSDTVKSFQQLQQFRTIFELPDADKDLRMVQLPFPENSAHYRWLGTTFPSTTEIKGDNLSLALELPDSFQPDQPIAGWVVDSWREALPAAKKTSSLAMHYDQPNAEPPQTLLLCVGPQQNATWDWRFLKQVVLDTIDMAKKRAIDPEILGRGLSEEGIDDGPLKYLLPAVFAPSCKTGNTASIDFETVSKATD